MPAWLERLAAAGTTGRGWIDISREQENLAQTQRGETQEVPEGEARHGLCPRPVPEEPQISWQELQGPLP